MQLLIKNVRTYLCKKIYGNLNAITENVSYHRNKSIFQSISIYLLRKSPYSIRIQEKTDQK